MSRRVLIAGGGVAALEAALALRELAPAEVELAIVAPGRVFALPPDTVLEAVGGPPAARFDLVAIAEDLGVELIADALDSVAVGRRHAITCTGRELAYDGLLLALGALPGPVLRGALPFGGARDVETVRTALDGVAGLARPRIAFVATAGVGWTLPLYELALLVADRFDAEGRDRELTVVTPEGEPLAMFGRTASQKVGRRLMASRIGIRTGTLAEGVDDGQLWLAVEGSLPVDLVVALPEPVGPDIPGLPADQRGFVPVDRFGRVQGVDGVWAAGDITARPVKQGGLAAQQAEVAALSIAAWAGAAVEPRPYEPVLRGMLLGGETPQFLRRASMSSVPSAVSDRPLWSPAVKLAGRRVGPYLAAHPGLRLDDSGFPATGPVIGADGGAESRT